MIRAGAHAQPLCDVFEQPTRLRAQHDGDVGPHPGARYRRAMHKIHSAVRWLVAATTVAFHTTLFFACSSLPEDAGDACDPDGDPCPAGMVCQVGADDETLCLLGAGEPCDAEADDPYCAPSLVCAADLEDGSRCLIAEGGDCDPDRDDPYCAGNSVCAELESGGHACYPPVLVRGRVFDAVTEDGVAGAHVLALDDQSTAISGIAIAAADGAYELSLPVARDADGAPIDSLFTLRSSAQDYQTFPSGLRTSLPIETGDATRADDETGYVIELPLTDIALLPLPEEETGRPSISGAVKAGELSAGVLVVAEGDGAGLTAISAKGGLYTIFNVPSGEYVVSGYSAGVALEPASADVASADVDGVDLVATDAGLGSISGSVQIVNAPGGSTTSVVLVVESTFDDTFVRGEVGRGLRTPLGGPPTVDGAFTIAGVPPGRYVVLAAFENDGLVRDPDENISGTQIVHVEMPGQGDDIALDESFKITEALEILAPGAEDPEPVEGTPTFRWADDSSEDYYTVVVYDAFGDLVWEALDVPSGSGDEVSLEYGGPALQPGMYYQFRATSWRTPGGNPSAISQTEDLRGVFYLP